MKRTTRLAVGLGAVVVLAGAVVVAAFGFGGTDPAPPPVGTRPPGTAKVTSSTLTSTEKVAGTTRSVPVMPQWARVLATVEDLFRTHWPTS